MNEPVKDRIELDTALTAPEAMVPETLDEFSVLELEDRLEFGLFDCDCTGCGCQTNTNCTSACQTNTNCTGCVPDTNCAGCITDTDCVPILCHRRDTHGVRAVLVAARAPCARPSGINHGRAA